MVRLRFACVLTHVLVVGWCTSLATAQLVINRFDDPSEATQWYKDWGGVTSYSFTHDAAMDAGGGATTGSLKVEVDYSNTITCDAGCNNFAFTRSAGGALDLTGYATVDMDIWVDPSSPKRGTSNDHGYLGTALRDGDSWTSNFEGGRGLQPDGQWVHVSIPINSYPNGPHNSVRALTLQNWGGDTGTELNGKLILWIDNVVITPKPGGPASTVVINDFNTAAEVSDWWFDQFTPQPVPTITFDPTTDAENSPASGSMKIVIDFNMALYENAASNIYNNKMLINRNFPGAPYDAREYDYFICRVKVDPASPKDPGGTHGGGEWVFRNDWGWNPVSGAGLASSGGAVDSNGWHVYDVIITSSTTPARDMLRALTFQLWGGGWQNLTGTTTLWIDHIAIGRSKPCQNPTNCEICNNSADDNGDGKVDCADPDCHGGAFCPLETACENHLDDNANGMADCADPDCAESTNCKANEPFADMDGDGDVDQEDFGRFQICFTGGSVLSGPGCGVLDRAHDGFVDAADLQAFLKCATTGPDVPADTNCDN